MNQLLTDPKKRARLEWWMDALALGSVLQYCIYRFLQSTMFQFYYSKRYKLFTMALLLFFGGIRYLYKLVQKWNEREDKKGFVIRVIGAWILALPFFYVGWKHDYKFLIFLPICCMCLYDMDSGKVCRWFFVTIGICLAATVLCCLSGTVRNIVWWTGDITISEGFINNTDFASYFTFLLLVGWCGIRNRKWYVSVSYALLSLVISYIVNHATDSRTVLYCGFLMSGLMLWDVIEEKVLRKHQKLSILGKGINSIAIMAFPLIGLLIIFFIIRFVAGDRWALDLNYSLSDRLNTVLAPIQKYGVHAFGSKINNGHGFGATMIRGGGGPGSGYSAGYSYIDVSYAALVVKFGWILAGVFTVLWVWMTIRALKFGNNRIALTLTVLAFHAFSEARILDINYNIFLALPFAALSMKDLEEKVRNTNWISIAVGVVMIVGVWHILPRGLSWLRAFFSVQQWKIGTAAFYSFIFCVGIISLLVLLWKSISGENGVKKRVISSIGIACVLSAVGLHMNTRIDNGLQARAEKIETELTVVRTVKEVATAPVYAAEPEEFYRRYGEKQAFYCCSTEELYRSKGTLFTDQETELFGISLFGGQHTQVSENRGIYSYDLAVIKALENIGYVWTPYYSGRKIVNLSDVARFNGMSPNFPLVLKDGARITTENMETDQFEGTYEVKLEALLLSKGSEGLIGKIEILGEAGETVIYQEDILSDCFDDSGLCERTIVYQTRSIPKVSFAISVSDQASIEINEISWQRVQ